MKRLNILVLAAPFIVFELLLQVTAPAGSQEQAKPKMVTVGGKLIKVAAIGAKTTGWTIDLDKPLQVGGNSLTQIEVLDHKELDGLANRRIEAKGILGKRSGIERGEYWVLVVGKIQTINN